MAAASTLVEINQSINQSIWPSCGNARFCLSAVSVILHVVWSSLYLTLASGAAQGTVYLAAPAKP